MSCFTRILEMMRITFKRETVSDTLMDEMVPLISKHFIEIAEKRGMTLKPDWDHYQKLEEAGNLRVYTAREMETNILVGYSVFVVAIHPHFADDLQAHEDLLFLDPEMRKGLTGFQFLRFGDKALKVDGVSVVHRMVTKQLDYAPLLNRMGYDPIDIVYARKL